MRIIFAFILLAFSGTLTAQNVGQESDTLINYVDINGFKQGHWKVYHNSGKPKFEGYFVDNRPVGEFKKWDKVGRLFADLYYEQAEGDMYAKFYHVSGKMASEGKYLGKAKDSVWMYCHSNGKRILQESYKKGVNHGVFKQYSLNGSLIEEVTWVNGVRQGPWRKYFSSGEMMSEVNLVDGKMEGETKSYYKTGKVYMEGKYVNDLKEGAWFKYSASGALLKLYQYKNGISPEAQAETQEELEEFERNKGEFQGPINSNDLEWLRGNNSGRY